MIVASIGIPLFHHRASVYESLMESNSGVEVSGGKGNQILSFSICNLKSAICN